MLQTEIECKLYPDYSKFNLNPNRNLTYKLLETVCFIQIYLLRIFLILNLYSNYL